VTIRSKLAKVARAREDGRLVPMAASWMRALGKVAVNPASDRVRLHAPPFVQPDASELPLVRRIFAAFRLMKEQQRRGNPLYLPSSLWQETFDAAFPSLATSLDTGDIDAFHYFLANFGAWPEYTGITWSPLVRSGVNSTLRRRYLENEVFLRQAELWRWFYGNRVPFSELRQPQHGNQYGAYIDGEFVTVLVESIQPIMAITVPRAAVLSDQQGEYVYAVDDKNIVQQRRVKLGQSTPSTAVILSGLDEGEMVVLEGIQRVRGGIQVAPGPATPPPTAPKAAGQ